MDYPSTARDVYGVLCVFGVLFNALLPDSSKPSHPPRTATGLLDDMATHADSTLRVSEALLKNQSEHYSPLPRSITSIVEVGRL